MIFHAAGSPGEARRSRSSDDLISNHNDFPGVLKRKCFGTFFISI